MKDELLQLLNEFFKYIDHENDILYGQHRALEEYNGLKYGVIDKEKSLTEFYKWLQSK